MLGPSSAVCRGAHSLHPPQRRGLSAHLSPPFPRGSGRTAPTWPSCSACRLPRAASSASACWTPCSTRSAGAARGWGPPAAQAPSPPPAHEAAFGASLPGSPPSVPVLFLPERHCPGLCSRRPLGLWPPRPSQASQQGTVGARRAREGTRPVPGVPPPHCGPPLRPVLREGLHDLHHQAAAGPRHHAGLRLPLRRE